MRLLVHSVPIAGGIIGGGGEITWQRPTRPGDVLNVVSTIINISPSKSKPDRGIVTIQSHTLNQHGELCQRLIAKVLVFSFFFQAEDGIRDDLVTGVQTCALPI